MSAHKLGFEMNNKLVYFILACACLLFMSMPFAGWNTTFPAIKFFSQSYKNVPARIIDLHLSDCTTKWKNNTYPGKKVVIEYSWYYENIRYFGHNYSADDKCIKPEAAELLTKKYAEGSQINISVSMRDAKEAILDIREYRDYQIFVLMYSCFFGSLHRCCFSFILKTDLLLGSDNLGGNSDDCFGV